jgi:hypothetical protein
MVVKEYWSDFALSFVDSAAMKRAYASGYVLLDGRGLCDSSVAVEYF